jgi:hypothetical protein
VNYSKRIKPGNDWWTQVSENLEKLTADNRELHIVARDPPRSLKQPSIDRRSTELIESASDHQRQQVRWLPS